MSGTANNNNAPPAPASPLASRLSSLAIRPESRPGGGSTFGRGGPQRPMRPSGGWGKWIALAVLVALGGTGWIARDRILATVEGISKLGSTEEAPKIKTIVVQAQPAGGAPPVLIAGGKIVSDQRVYVSTKVSGQILEMRVEQGDRVVADETVIAVIERTDYEARLRQADANHAKARRDVEKFRAEVAKAAADVERVRAVQRQFAAEARKAATEVERMDADIGRADAEVNRFAVLARNARARLADYEKFAASKATTQFELRDARADFEAAEQQHRSAQAARATVGKQREWTRDALEAAKAAEAAAAANLQVAEAAVAKAEADVRVAEAAVAAAAAVRDQELKRFNDCEVKAPISGVVLERSATVGDYVTEGGGRGGIANSQFVTLADTDRLRVEVDVTEMDINKLVPFMPCTVIPDANKDRRFRGYILWIDPLSNYSKATVQTKVRINKQPGDERWLRIEGAAKVEFRPQTPEMTRAGGLLLGGAAARADLLRPDEPGETAGSGDDKAAAAKGPLWVPASAIKDGKVQKVDGEGRLRIVAVKTGGRTGNQVEVREGVRAGDVLVSEFDPELADGRLVKPPAGK